MYDHTPHDPMGHMNAIEAAWLAADPVATRCPHCAATRTLVPMGGAGWAIDVTHDDACPEHEDLHPAVPMTGDPDALRAADRHNAATVAIEQLRDGHDTGQVLGVLAETLTALRDLAGASAARRLHLAHDHGQVTDSKVIHGVHALLVGEG